MATYLSTSVEIPVVFSDIVARVVAQFSRANRLQAISWYHDQPIWFVKKEDKTLVRRVQITPFLTESDGTWHPVLRLIPDIYELTDGRITQYIHKSDIQAHIETVQLLSPPDFRPRPPADVEKELHAALQRAWSYAQRL